MADRSKDWFTQATRNLNHARSSVEAGHYEWACFAAQQAAEMAVKAVHLKRGQIAWGHVIRVLLENLPPASVPDDLLDEARLLDAHYLPTRYPNGHAAGAPYQNYGPTQAEEAIRCANRIIEFCRLQMAGS